MIPISPGLIKLGIGIAAVAAIILYINHLQNDVEKYKKDFETEQANHQSAANTLLSERISALRMQEKALELEKKFNEIHKANDAYRECVANRTCYVSLRQPTKKESGLLPNAGTTSSKLDDSPGSIELTVQQDIFHLEASIKIDELKIIELQNYINTECYKTNY
jgi:hypothetical protein